MAYIGVSPSNGIRRVFTYTATANQTSFSGVGAENITLSYKDANYVDVYQNGVKLASADYTATSGTAIVLPSPGASEDDMIVIVVFDVFSAADTVSKADGGQFDGNVTMAGTLAVTGNADLNGNLDVDGTANLDVVDIDGAVDMASTLTLAGNADFNGNLDVDGTTNLDVVDIDGAVDMASTLGVAGVVTANAGVVVDNITIDGTEIDLSSGNLTIDVAGQLVINSDSGQVVLQDDTVNWGNLQNSSGDFVIESLGTDKDIIFKGLDDSSVIEAMRIDMSLGGFVGIGNAGPSTKLHIRSAQASNIAAYRGGTTSLIVEGDTASYIQIVANKQAPMGILFDGGNTHNDSARGGLIYDIDTGLSFKSGGSTRCTIDESGNVGIGNTNPSDFGSLTDNLVIGTTSGENGMTIATGTSNSGRIQFADNTSSPFRGAIEYAHSNDHLFFYTAGSQQLKITNSGFIQSPPTAGNTVSSSANMFITSGGEFAKSTSSKRYKNTINDATHGLTELLKLRSVTYKGNNDGDIVFGGLIAEEVHDVGLTEFVQYDDEDRPDSLHYTHMVALCIKAIQELKAENTALANRITALENA